MIIRHIVVDSNKVLQFSNYLVGANNFGIILGNLIKTAYDFVFISNKISGRFDNIKNKNLTELALASEVPIT